MGKLREKQRLLFFFSIPWSKRKQERGFCFALFRSKNGWCFRVCFHDYSKVAIDVLRRSCFSDAMSFTVTTAATYANNRKDFLLFFVCF